MVGHTQHIGNHHEASGPGEQGTLLCRAPQDLFFVRPVLSGVEDRADFPNTEKQTHRFGQNEETKDYVPNERTRQNESKRPK